MNHISTKSLILGAASAAVLGGLVYLTGFMRLSFLYSGMGYIGGDWPQPVPNLWYKAIVWGMAVVSISGFIAGIWGGLRSGNKKWLAAGLLLALLNAPFILRSGKLQYLVREAGICEVHGGYPWGVSPWCKWYPS